MKKVIITMEADVTDLPAFNEDVSVLDIRGAGRENVWDIFNNLRIQNNIKIAEQIAIEKETEPKIQKALLIAMEDEKRLLDRLLKNTSIEYKIT